MTSEPVTLISGSRKGIGRFLAERYLRAGHRVIGCSRGECEWQAEGYRHIQADVGDERAAMALFAAIRQDYGRLDHLINNAGAASMNHSLLTPVATVQRLLDTNLAGTFLFSREAAKLMKKNAFGRIVNFTSVAVPMKLAGEAAYVASKAGVQALTEVMAREFADFGITVNAVGPTPVDTDLIRNVPPAKIEALVARQSIRRLGTVEDVANVVDFFLDRRSEFVTGQILYLGGP